MDDILPYRIQKDCYTWIEESDIDQYQKLIVATLDGSLTIPEAARQITDLVADLAERDKQEIDLSNENRPYPSDAEVVGVAIGSAASSFPPSHSAHERLVCLLQASTSAPRRQIPDPVLDRDLNLRPAMRVVEHLIDKRPVIFLWEDLDRMHLGETYKWIAEDGQSLWTGVEKRGSEEQQRWRNLSFFCANLTEENIADLSYLSALFMLLPKEQDPKTTPGWSGLLAGQALAAAQWIVPEGHGAWVWQQCRRVTRFSAEERPPRRKWNLEYWQIWKAAFREVAERVDDERVHEVDRREASKAVKIMEELESH